MPGTAAMGMPRVDFYLSDPATEGARLHLICRLVDKAYAAGRPTLVLGDDRRELAALDELLWTSLDGSFIPHELAAADAPAADTGTGAAYESPVLLATQVPGQFPRALLINLGHEVPAAAGEFERVIEVPGGDAASRQQARVRFRAYRRLGAEPATHQVGGQPAAGRPL
jgi:DNA polymerase-3 subunit chi